MKKIGFLLETLAGFAILWILNLLLLPRNLGFIGVSPHPYLILVVLITCRYGYLKGLGAPVVTTLIYLVCLYRSYQAPETALFTPVAGFIIFHTITGMVTDGYRKKLEKSTVHVNSLTRLSENLELEKKKIEQHNNELSQRLLAERSTFAILYRAARTLSTLDKETLFHGVISLLKEVIDAENSALFLLEGNTLLLKNASKKNHFSKYLPDHEIIERVITEKKTFSIKDSHKGKDEVFLCGPLLLGSEGIPFGIILIQGLDFMKYNPTTVRIFTLICDWASICLKNIIDFEEKVPDEVSSLLKEEWMSQAANSFQGLFPFGSGEEEIWEAVKKL